MKIVVAGAGLVGKRHIEAMQGLQHLALEAIVDPSESARDVAEVSAVPLYASLEDMFARHRPDGVILATPNLLHVEGGLACVEQGCAMLVEKPIAATAEDALRLVEAAGTAGVPVLVGHHRRHNPIIARAKALIDSGELGDLRTVHASCWFFKPEHYFDIAPWRKLSGAGPVSVNLVHDVDLLRYLGGEIISVQAQFSASTRGYENEEVAAALLRFANGALGTLTISDTVVSPWSWEMTARENPVYAATDQSCYQFGGTRGALSVPDLALWRHQPDPDWFSPISATRFPCDTADPLVAQLDHFAAVIQREAEPLVSAEEGLKSLRVIEAVQHSMRNGTLIEL